MNIETLQDLKTAVRNGPYVWPGGYPIFFVASDGAPLSFKTVKDNYHQIAVAVRDHDNLCSWRVVAADINYEDSDLYCEHSGEHIESAYADGV